jgi:hypothetical protein
MYQIYNIYSFFSSPSSTPYSLCLPKPYNALKMNEYTNVGYWENLVI